MLQRWFQKFRNRDEALEDEEDCERKAMIKNEQLKALV